MLREPEKLTAECCAFTLLEALMPLMEGPCFMFALRVLQPVPVLSSLKPCVHSRMLKKKGEGFRCCRMMASQVLTECCSWAPARTSSGF